MPSWMWAVAGIAAVGVGAKAVAARWRSPKTVILNPSLGVLNLAGVDGNALAHEDLTHLESLFSVVRRSDYDPPLCNVLLLYCQIGPNGKVSHSSRSLREIIRDSEAQIVVVGTDHPVDNYIGAAQPEAFGQANLVLSLSRKGSLLPRFLARLFSKMKQGTSMPVAWNELAPQIPGIDHDDTPEAIFACERGQVAFA